MGVACYTSLLMGVTRGTLPNPGKGAWKTLSFHMYVHAQNVEDRKLEPPAGQVPVGVNGLTRACRRATVSCDGRSVSSRVGT